MKDHRRLLHRVRCQILVALLVVAAMLGPAVQAEQPEPTEQCVSFSDWDAPAEVESAFAKDDFVFETFQGEPQLIYETDTSYGPGLQVAETGVFIRLPRPSSQVALRTVSYNAEPLQITAFNDDGTVIDQITAPSDPQGTVHTVDVSGQQITGIVTQGGQNEGVLVEVCIQTEAEPPVEEPSIARVDPAEGRCGSEITLTVFGANLEPESTVFIPEGVETRYTEFISPEELVAAIFIAEDAPPGPRPVQVSGPERGMAVLEDGFTATCPPAEPEGRPDLALLDLDWQIVDQGDLLIIAARVENVGDAPAPEATLYAESQLAAWWTAEAAVPELDSGASVEVQIRLGIPDELRGSSHPFSVGVEPGEEIAEWDVNNNWQAIEIWVPETGEPPLPPPELTEVPSPGPPPEPGPDLSTLILTVVVVVGVTVAGATLTMRRTIRIRRRKEWQEQAKEEDPPETCRPCTRHCQKIKIEELELARRKITHLTLIAYDPVSGRARQTEEIRGEVVDGLDRAVKARRRRQEPEELQRLVTPVAGALFQQIGEWLRREPVPHDVYIAGHLAGSEATFQFILRHCRRRGQVNVWEEEDEWKVTVADERDEPVATLRGLDPAAPGMLERLAPALTQRLMQFIEQV